MKTTNVAQKATSSEPSRPTSSSRPGVLVNVERAKKLMDREDLDGLIASTLENTFYMSGSWSEGLEQHPYDDESYVVATRDALAAGVIVLSVGAVGQALEAYSTLQRIVTHGKHFREVAPDVTLNHEEEWVKAVAVDRTPKPSGFDALADSIIQCGLAESSVGVDELGSNRQLLAKLAERFPKMRVKPAFHLFREIRMVKTAEEQDRMVRALRGSEAAIRTVGEALREGVTELEMFKVANEAIVQADCLPLWSSVRFGRNMAYGTISDATPLKKGDSIWFDIGCTYLGYRSDIGRTFSFGEPSAKQRRLYDACKAGQSRALELLKPGVTAGHVFAKAVERVRESGIPEYKRRHVGHGIGIEWYELPRMVPDSDFVIDLGTMLEVETPYYELGFGGAMLEDLAVVTPNGAKLFSELDRDLGVFGT